MLFRSRLAELVLDSAKRARFGKRARELAVAEHDWNRIFEKLEAVYLDAVAGYTPKPA